jgi:hypothetical protein
MGSRRKGDVEDYLANIAASDAFLRILEEPDDGVPNCGKKIWLNYAIGEIHSGARTRHESRKQDVGIEQGPWLRA